MMMYLWLLLTLPHDRLVCELWTRELPTPAALVQTCGTDALGDYRLDVLENGVGICSAEASALVTVAEECGLNAPLDHYRLRIVEPGYQELIGCTVKTSTMERPSTREIRAQCPATKEYEVRFARALPAAPEPEPSVCKPPTLEQPDSIATRTELHLLAGKLLWHGYAKPDCLNGYSGVNPDTFSATPCGMDGARGAMIDWQNSLDDAILSASREWNVPAASLKELIQDETQFWPWTGTHGEHGLIQITDDGAAVVLHVYQTGYYRMDEARRFEARTVWLRALDCNYCSPRESLDHARRVMGLYAQSLAAYYCMFGSWDAALGAWNAKYLVN